MIEVQMDEKFVYSGDGDDELATVVDAVFRYVRRYGNEEVTFRVEDGFTVGSAYLNITVDGSRVCTVTGGSLQGLVAPVQELMGNRKIRYFAVREVEHKRGEDDE